MKLEEILKPKLVTLILQTVSKNPAESHVEFVHYMLELINVFLTH